MGKLFGIDIPKVVAGALRGNVARITLIKKTQGQPTVANPTGPPPATEITYRGEGFFGDWPGNFPANQSLRKNAAVQRGDQMIEVVGGSLRRGIRPAIGDRIVMGGQSYRIVAVGDDPAGSSDGRSATFKCQVRAG